ncbi:MAG TPA: amino acid adenylation domain-containing protein [Vicinamibacterales bacterium]|jgi:amino acid adenylation domain-containing protein
MQRLLQDLVIEQAGRRPESTAVVCGASTLSYGELDALSNRLARLLQDGGCQPGDRVALLMPKCPMAIVAMLGIYKACGIYVPLDPGSPASRLKKILESCQSRWVLTAETATCVLSEILEDAGWRKRLSIGWLDESQPAETLHVDFTPAALAGYSDAPVDGPNRPSDPAHILFTSGSTGVPKGVVITHSNVMHLVRWAATHFSMSASDRMSGHPPLYFDMSFLDVFGAAAVGAELHLVPPELSTFPNKLAAFIRDSALTQWFSVPSVLNYMAKFNVVGVNDFPALRRVMWAGDVLPATSLIYWMKRLPHVTFTNLYGPTETTIVSSYYTVPGCPDDVQAVIPIGCACEGEELLVLDESMHMVPTGETGELYIGGVGVVRGYWGDSERTEAAFVEHPYRPGERLYKTGDLARTGNDGLVYFLGRRDSQVKSRGYRIELGEIEGAVNALGGIRECAVVAVPVGGFEGVAICCAYAAAAGCNPTRVELRRELGRLVPSYMLPLHWLALASLPTNANGKIDRRRLLDVFESSVTAATGTA